jgi:D-alanyl-D-alanine carboxypeptidase
MIHKTLALMAGIAMLAGIPTAEAAETPLQRDADAIVATGVTGVQARVSESDRQDQVVTSGVAKVGSDRPVPQNGYFRAASTTKAFTATVILQLVGEKRLSLDDTVEKWLPGVVHGNDNDGRRITMRHLLQHSSGIHDDMPGFESPEDYYQQRFDKHTAQEYVAAAMRHRPDFEPGESWAYSSTGYLLLGMIIERATGSSWNVEIDRRIVRPLGLSHTYWPANEVGLRQPFAHAYRRFADGELVDVTRSRESGWGWAMGGLVSTTADLDRFFRALLGGRLLRAPELREMKQTVPAVQFQAIWPDAENGLGLFSQPLTCGGRFWGHSGDTTGAMTRVGFSEDGRRGAVVSMSTDRADSSEAWLAQDKAALRLIDRALCTR